MQNECYPQLQSIISQFHYIHGFLDDGFIRKQCDNTLINFLLKRLNNEKSSHFTRQHLPTLEKRLADLSSVTGYDRLYHLLRKASDWDDYQEVLAQLDITSWFFKKGLIKEIEPELPNRKGYSDILISFSQQDIYCEVTSFQSFAKSTAFEVKSQKKLLELQKRQPWKTGMGVGHELNIKRAVRNLLYKTDHQLPSNNTGILALETGKSGMFGFDVRIMAQKIFPNRPQVALLMLWSWEGDGQNDPDSMWERNNPSHCFINPGAHFPEVGERLANYLSLKGEVIGL